MITILLPVASSVYQRNFGLVSCDLLDTVMMLRGSPTPVQMIV